MENQGYKNINIINSNTEVFDANLPNYLKFSGNIVDKILLELKQSLYEH